MWLESACLESVLSMRQTPCYVSAKNITSVRKNCFHQLFLMLRGHGWGKKCPIIVRSYFTDSCSDIRSPKSYLIWHSRTLQNFPEACWDTAVRILSSSGEEPEQQGAAFLYWSQSRNVMRLRLRSTCSSYWEIWNRESGLSMNRQTVAEPHHRLRIRLRNTGHKYTVDSSKRSALRWSLHESDCIVLESLRYQYMFTRYTIV
jgi:hypothetical protein